MTVIGNPRSFHKKFKFIVEIDDVGHAGFQKCSELSVEVANVQYFEGGSLIPNKTLNRPSFAPPHPFSVPPTGRCGCGV